MLFWPNPDTRAYMLKRNRTTSTRPKSDGAHETTSTRPKSDGAHETTSTRLKSDGAHETTSTRLKSDGAHETTSTRPKSDGAHETTSTRPKSDGAHETTSTRPKYNGAHDSVHATEYRHYQHIRCCSDGPRHAQVTCLRRLDQLEQGLTVSTPLLFWSGPARYSECVYTSQCLDIFWCVH